MDIQNLPKWDRGVASTFDTFGMRDRGRKSYEVTKIRAPYEHEAVTRSGYFKLARWHFTMETLAGGTAVTCVSEFSLRSRYLWLAPVAALAGGRAIRTDLAELKRVVEGNEEGRQA